MRCSGFGTGASVQTVATSPPVHQQTLTLAQPGQTADSGGLT